MDPAPTPIPASEPVQTRRFPRYKVDIPVRLIVRDVMKSSIFDGRGSSLNEGGMAIFAGTELRPGDRVAVEFTPPYCAPPVRVDARVCNRNGYLYGVEFLTESMAQRQDAALLRRHWSSLTGGACD